MTKNELVRDIFKEFDGKQISEDRDFRKGLQEGFKYGLDMLDICESQERTLESCTEEIRQYEGYLMALETVVKVMGRLLNKEKKDERNNS